MNEDWKRIDVPPIAERLIGFSVPQDDLVLVLSYEGVHILSVAESVTVKNDFDTSVHEWFAAGEGWAHCDGRAWQMLGPGASGCILNGVSGETLELDDKMLRIAVRFNGSVTWSSTFENFSGDWATATFSPDGNLIVLGCPYDFDFRIWRRGLP